MKRAFFVMVCAAASGPRNVMHDAGEPGRPLLPAELFRQRTLHPDAAERNSQGDDGLRSDDGDQDHRADFFSPLRKIIAAAGLFDGHALGEVSRLVHVAAEFDGDVVGQELQRNDGENRR